MTTDSRNGRVGLDREWLRDAVHLVAKRWYAESGEVEDWHMEVNSEQLADEIAAEYEALQASEVTRGD